MTEPIDLSKVMLLNNHNFLPDISHLSIDTTPIISELNNHIITDMKNISIPLFISPQYLNTEQPDFSIINKTPIENELSKIHEELATQNQTITELRHEVKDKDEMIKKLKEENEQLKAKLKRSRAKTKTVKKTYDSELEEMQEDMNCQK